MVNFAFSRDEIVEALQRWTREHGEPPRGVDLEPARARRLGQEWRAERFESGTWPSARMVTKQFGSMTAALRSAGIEPRRAPARVATNLTGPDAIVNAIHGWIRLYGEVPTLADWDPPRARRLRQDWRIARYYRGDWPSTRTVVARFGSMSNAIRAAGIPPRPVGSHGQTRARERTGARRTVVAELATAYAADTSSPDELARAVRKLATARRREDPSAIHSALIDIAAHSLAWAEVAGN